MRSGVADCNSVDRYIHIFTASDLTTLRGWLVDDIFGGSLPSEVGTLSSVTSPVAGLTGLSTTEKITFSGFDARPRVWTPSSANGDLMILHQGHSGNYNDYSFDVALQTYLTEGFVVCGLVMPGGVDEVTSGTSTSHNSTTPALSTFIGPVIAAINTLEGDVSGIYMSGLSGGGWTTTLAAAVDTRIVKSYPTAGSLPITSYVNRDYEQYLDRIPLRATYQDLYILGSSPAGRRQKQILHTTDSCCFNLQQYNSTPSYSEKVSNRAAELGGSFELVWVVKTDHEFDSTIITDEIFPEIT